MIRMCRQLLDQADVESAIRVGDVYALLIEYQYSQGQMEQAYQYIEDMRTRNIILDPFLDQSIIAAVYSYVTIILFTSSHNSVQRHGCATNQSSWWWRGRDR